LKKELARAPVEEVGWNLAHLMRRANTTAPAVQTHAALPGTGR
jgi:hypothetical protein